MKFKLIIFSMVISFLACGTFGVRVDGTSYTDPSFNKNSINKILVYANVHDYAYREEIETAFVKYIVRYKYDCTAVMSKDIIPRTREFTKEQIITILKNNGIDAVLIFSIKDSGYYNQSITVNQPYRTSGNIYRSGNNYYYDATTDGGPQTYNYSKPYLLADVDIFDVKTGIKIWTAQFDAGGNAFANTNDALIKTITETIKKMAKDGIVQ
ncbi:MAG: hypothetical protein ACUVRK_12945 [Spirochaetota bacterium]